MFEVCVRRKRVLLRPVRKTETFVTVTLSVFYESAFSEKLCCVHIIRIFDVLADVTDISLCQTVGKLRMFNKILSKVKYLFAVETGGLRTSTKLYRQLSFGIWLSVK